MASILGIVIIQGLRFCSAFPQEETSAMVYFFIDKNLYLLIMAFFLFLLLEFFSCVYDLCRRRWGSSALQAISHVVGQLYLRLGYVCSFNL